MTDRAFHPAGPSSGTRVIDAHQHFWRTAAQRQPWRQPSHHRLERDFSPDDLIGELDAAGIDATVLIQSVDEPAENRRLAEYGRHPRVAGVVAWAPIRDAPAAHAELDRLELPGLVGVRCLIADDPLDWLTRPAALTVFRRLAAEGLAWDVVPITEVQITAVLRLAELVPDLRIVVDHLGRPPIDRGGWEPWSTQLGRLAGCPNVAVKISIGIDVLGSWPAWDAAAVGRYVHRIRELFGPRRLMLASNWPVITLRTDYQTAWRDLTGLALQDIGDPAAVAAIRGGTAERWYRLPTETDGAGRKERARLRE